MVRARRRSFSDVLEERGHTIRTNLISSIHNSYHIFGFTDLFIDDTNSPLESCPLAHWLYEQFYSNFKYNRCREQWVSLEEAKFLYDMLKVDKQMLQTRKVSITKSCGKHRYSFDLTIFPPLYESEDEEDEEE